MKGKSLIAVVAGVVLEIFGIVQTGMAISTINNSRGRFSGYTWTPPFSAFEQRTITTLCIGIICCIAGVVIFIAALVNANKNNEASRDSFANNVKKEENPSGYFSSLSKAYSEKQSSLPLMSYEEYKKDWQSKDSGYNGILGMVILLNIAWAIIFIIAIVQKVNNGTSGITPMIILSFIIAIIGAFFEFQLSSKNRQMKMDYEKYKNAHIGNIKEKKVVSYNSGEWTCSKCGRVNMNYVGTCGCGETKPR